MKIESILKLMVQKGASDLFLKVGQPVALRIGGEVESIGGPPLKEGQLEEVLEKLTSKRIRNQFLTRGEADTSIELEGVGRFRGTIFRQRGHLGMVFRHISSEIPSFEDLHLPREAFEEIASKSRGLVLVTGVTGSGKSTTLAAMLEYINEHRKKHVVTIEDPIEYVFEDKLSLFDQREVGEDTESFSAALKSVVRQSPDVIMIGEMRDRETMESAFHAAETGHLVFSTLHTMNAAQTIDRILLYLPPHLHRYYQKQMSLLLQAVISQRLLICQKEDIQRLPAVEIMITSPTIRDLLEEGKTREINRTIREGKYFGSQTFNQSLKELYEEKMITKEQALAAADYPDELEMEMRGILKNTDQY